MKTVCAERAAVEQLRREAAEDARSATAETASSVLRRPTRSAMHARGHDRRDAEHGADHLDDQESRTDCVG